MKADQLVLGVQLRDNARFDNFVAGDNQQVLSQIAALAAGAGERQCYCWSQPGLGKSHLLQAACHEAQETGRSSMYVPLQSTGVLTPALLDGLAELDLVCLDDVHQVAGNSDWEAALFSCYNALRHSGTALLISANAAPGSLSLGLPDLQSRLGWGPVYQLQALSDDQCMEALKLRARGRGLDLPDETAGYLVKRVPRTLAALLEMLDTLDLASLAAKKKLTVPFVREVLNIRQ